ncbi:multiple epidermal growth factor-like domains protein 11 isoform X1 [Apis mellifera carnica]|nr:multiple epidermal growth factor-like domains protein 11 isoform X1 [Apis mellifera carnica]
MRCLGLVVFLNLVTEALFLTGKDGSVCNVQVSRMVSRYVPYTETYKVKKWTFFHQTKFRTNYRIDHVPVWKFEERCCDGYEERYDVCEPVCNPGCVNGRCTRPNSCECHIGYSPSEYDQYMCLPVCESHCPNGVCTNPNQCSCNVGFELSEDELHCLPVCAQDCAHYNAHCTDPNHCTCNSGYRQSDAAAYLPSCTPICEIPCVNGKCGEPNVCTCDYGYEKDIDPFVCKP